jgi:hypothetical protein
MRKVREEEVGVFLAQTLRKVREEEADVIARTVRNVRGKD